MSCTQIIAYGTHVSVSPTYRRTSPRLASNVSSYQRCNTVCLFGGERKAGNGDEASPWKSLEQAIQGIRKEKSVQDVLREQMQKREFGGGDGSPPGGGGGGGGGRGGSGGGSEDEGMGGVMDEVLQVFLATAGFIFVYTYILKGEDVPQMIKDIIKFIFTRKLSTRLSRMGERWKKLYEQLARKEVVQKDWLEREIINTPTWWHNPAKVKRVLGHRLASGYYDK